MDKVILPLTVYLDWRELNFKKFDQFGFNEIEQLINKYPEHKVYLFGYSLGAVIVLNYIRDNDCEKIFLCSPSPVFKEEIDLHNFIVRNFIRFFLKDNIAKMPYPKLDNKQAIFVYGKKEGIYKKKKIIANRNKAFSFYQDFLSRPIICYIRNAK